MTYALMNDNMRMLTDAVFTVIKCVNEMMQMQEKILIIENNYEELVVAFSKLYMLTTQEIDFFEHEDLIKYFRKYECEITTEYYIEALFEKLSSMFDELYKLDVIHQSKNSHLNNMIKLADKLIDQTGKYVRKIKNKNKNMDCWYAINAIINIKYDDFVEWKRRRERACDFGVRSFMW